MKGHQHQNGDRARSPNVWSSATRGRAICGLTLHSAFRGHAPPSVTTSGGLRAGLRSTAREARRLRALPSRAAQADMSCVPLTLPYPPVQSETSGPPTRRLRGRLPWLSNCNQRARMTTWLDRSSPARNSTTMRLPVLRCHAKSPLASTVRVPVPAVNPVCPGNRK